MYIDEVGNHDLRHVDDENHRFLSLTGITLSQGYATKVLKPEMDALKVDYFNAGPGRPVIFHRSDMMNRRPPFEALRDEFVAFTFNEDLLEALARWDYEVVTVVIDKRELRDKYQRWVSHPYHYCLHVLLERYLLTLKRHNARGDVMVECRGRKEDGMLQRSFQKLVRNGTDYCQGPDFQQYFSAHALKLRPKIDDEAGLQLADLIAHPSRREILIDRGLIPSKGPVFGDRVCDILRKDKYCRRPDGCMEGWGKKFLP